MQENSFDLIVLDQNMPGYKGTELLPMIIQKNPKAKVVIASGDRLPAVEQEALLGTIEKPFVLSSLLSQIEKFLDV